MCKHYRINNTWLAFFCSVSSKHSNKGCLLRNVETKLMASMRKVYSINIKRKSMDNNFTSLAARFASSFLLDTYINLLDSTKRRIWKMFEKFNLIPTIVLYLLSCTEAHASRHSFDVQLDFYAVLRWAHLVFIFFFFWDNKMCVSKLDVDEGNESISMRLLDRSD